jgi:phenylpropionate dioxygenase-like ring-hydroxylating dioxygenase large terminal subunit
VTALEHDGLTVARSADVAATEVVAVEAFGEKLVLFRTASGTAQVVSRFCPHLGANLVRFGVIRGELLQCRSHKWTYDCSGACVSAPGEEVPPAEALVSYRTIEHDGTIVAFPVSAREEN